MFSNWMFARLRAAEKALREGRIDDAYERLAAPDLLQDAGAARRLDELAAALIARARLNLQAGRYAEALEDLDRARTLGREGEAGGELRGRANAALSARRARQARDGAEVRRAADQIEAGRLESGRVALNKIADADQRDQLRAELDIREERANALLDDAEKALAAGDYRAAFRHWQASTVRHGQSARTVAVAGRIAAAYQTAMDECWASGRLELMRECAAEVERLRSAAPSAASARAVLPLLESVATHLAASAYAALRESLARLAAFGAEAPWLRAATENVEKILTAKTALLAGPLGRLEAAARPALTGARRGEDAAGEAPVDLAQAASVAGRPLLLLVDGTGSILLTASDRVRIGRAGGLPDVEVPIPADIQSHHADVIRDGEDYFLVAQGPVQVNHRRISRVLLRDGDRILLGRAAKLTFHKPSTRSDSAVLRLGSRFRLPLDVDQVVLFRSTCLLGPQQSCHVRTREGDARLVLFERDGRLLIRRADRDGRPAGPAEALPKDQTCDFGDIRLTVKTYGATGGATTA